MITSTQNMILLVKYTIINIINCVYRRLYYM